MKEDCSIEKDQIIQTPANRQNDELATHPKMGVQIVFVAYDGLGSRRIAEGDGVRVSPT
jgi:hypothetical protein